MSIDPCYFWRTPRAWPAELPGYVFLASAVQQIGKARYPISWAGDEPWISIPIPLPEGQVDASQAQVRKAYSLLEREADEIALPMMLMPKGGRQQSIPQSIPRALSADDWTAARLASLKVSVPRAEKSARWHDVMQITCALFRTGGLHCYVRELPGGEYQGPLDPVKVWNTEPERLAARFGLCQIDMGNLYGQTAYEAHNNLRQPSYSRQDFRYMFVDARSLANSLEAIGKIAPPPDWIAGRAPEPAGSAINETASPKPSNKARTGAEIKAAAECTAWLWETYISKSATATNTKRELRALAAGQPFWPRMRQSARAFNECWAEAIAKGNGTRDAWRLGDAAPK